MRRRESRPSPARAWGRRAVFLVLMAAGLGCASANAPPGWLPRATDAAADPYGGWIKLLTHDKHTVQGELIAVDGDSVHVLVSMEPGEEWWKDRGTANQLYVAARGAGRGRPMAGGTVLVGVHKREVRSADVTFYRPATSTAATWTIMGTLGSLSHGWGFILSGPVWIVTGTATAADVSRHPHRKLEEFSGSWETLRPYARFPMGLPPGNPVLSPRSP